MEKSDLKGFGAGGCGGRAQGEKRSVGGKKRVC